MSLNLEKLDLSKGVALNLIKEANLEGQKARVYVAMDYSGSMSDMYRSGFVQKVVERVMGIAMAFDDDQEIEFYRFDTAFSKRPNVTLANLDGYVNKHVMSGSMGGTAYAPVLNEIFKSFIGDTGLVSEAKGFFKSLFGSKPKAVTPPSGPAEAPAYVMFFTDGNTFDTRETEQIIRESANHGFFVQFIGLQSRYSEKFIFLEKLDDLSGRVLDNTNFFSIKEEDMLTLSDRELYSKLLNEFPGWVKQARTKGLIK